MTEAQRAARQCRIEQWSRAIRDRTHSGQSVTAWCEETGVSQRVYYYRLRQVRKYAARIMEIPDESTDAISELIPKHQGHLTPTAFTEVKLLEPAIQPAIPDNTHRGQHRVELGQLRITADCGYPAVELAVLLRELARP